MSGKNIIYYLLAAFIVGNLVLIFIQYNSAKNTGNLIQGNETLLHEYRVSADLRELERNMTAVESRVRGTVATEDSTLIEGLEDQIAEVHVRLSQLQQIGDNDSSIAHVQQLNELVERKLQISRQIIDSFRSGGRTAAEKLIRNEKARQLSDSIVLISNRLNASRENVLAHVTSSLDKSGKKATVLGIVLITLVLVIGALLFWFIVNIMLRQYELINQLNESEKKVREASQLKENFLANMSHEIRTPMNAILGFTNLLAKKPLDDESKEFVGTIRSSGESLLNIINDILDLSKIEAGMVKFEKTPFRIRDIAANLQSMFRIKAEEQQLDFTVEVDEALPQQLLGDGNRLMQILVNLASNAFKFTEAGSVAVLFARAGEEDDRILLRISVSDTGIGIAQEKVTSVFERFEQAEDSVTRRFGGTGLGLAIVKDLVELQGGTIDVKSELGTGSTFTMLLWYAVADSLSGESEVVGEHQLSAASVLVVEDNEVNVNLLRHLMADWGITITVACNGKEALDRLSTGQFDLVLMDIQMPEMDGYTATRAIRQKLKSNIPVIAMTAHVLPGEKERCIRAGMTGYIAKPLQENELREILARYLTMGKVISDKVVAFENKFEVIDLQYMKDVANGNTDYERSVTGQFIEAVPEELAKINLAWRSNNLELLRQTAHNLKTTISVMGLNKALNPLLDKFEHEVLSDSSFNSCYSELNGTLMRAVAEACEFQRQLASTPE